MKLLGFGGLNTARRVLAVRLSSQMPPCDCEKIMRPLRFKSAQVLCTGSPPAVAVMGGGAVVASDALVTSGTATEVGALGWR